MKIHLKFAGDADIEQYLKYYKNIMVDGFKIQGNSKTFHSSEKFELKYQ